LFATSDKPVVDECLRYAEEADVLVGIIAWRYGWIPNHDKSITEMVYDGVIEFSNHFFVHEKTPYLTVVLSYRELSYDEMHKGGLYTNYRRDLDKQELVAFEDL